MHEHDIRLLLTHLRYIVLRTNDTFHLIDIHNIIFLFLVAPVRLIKLAFVSFLAHRVRTVHLHHDTPDTSVADNGLRTDRNACAVNYR